MSFFADAELHAVDQAVQHVRGVELAIDQLVAHRGPGASLVGMILMPYFSSNLLTAAITTEAQSVSGMKPMRTSFFRGRRNQRPRHRCGRRGDHGH
jgi:hypothetical protein